jgi:hypothetical protein
MLSSCSSPRQDTAAPSAVPAPEVSFLTGTESFESLDLLMRGQNGSCMVNISAAGDGRSFAVRVENADFESREYIFGEPGYVPLLPRLQVNAPQAVNIYRNEDGTEDLPDVLQLMFTGEDPDSGSISSFFMIDGEGIMRPVDIYDYTAPGKVQPADYIDRTQITRAEPFKYIYEISVDDTDLYDDEGYFRDVRDRVRIKTMVFSPAQGRMSIYYEQIDEGNPLYFGYAWWAAANTAAQYFTLYDLPGIDYSSPVEVRDPDGTSGFYYPIEDDRFSGPASLRNYLGSLFTGAVADRIMNDAPQRYADIDGRLCARGDYDARVQQYGQLSFTVWEVNPNSMLFRSRQQIFDEYGNPDGYTDGGNFVIGRSDDGPWRIMRYRYPYI